MEQVKGFPGFGIVSHHETELEDLEKVALLVTELGRPSLEEKCPPIHLPRILFNIPTRDPSKINPCAIHSQARLCLFKMGLTRWNQVAIGDGYSHSHARGHPVTPFHVLVVGTVATIDAYASRRRRQAFGWSGGSTRCRPRVLVKHLVLIRLDGCIGSFLFRIHRYLTRDIDAREETFVAASVAGTKGRRRVDHGGGFVTAASIRWRRWRTSRILRTRGSGPRSTCGRQDTNAVLGVCPLPIPPRT